MRALRSFFHWLKVEGYTETHILKDLKVPRAQKNLVEILTEDEIKTLLGALDWNTATGARNGAMVWNLPSASSSRTSIHSQESCLILH